MRLLEGLRHWWRFYSAVMRITVLDGGMGRELARIGAPFRQPEWSALALTDGPERVVEAHMNFIEAGASVITTNTYAVVPFHIGEARFAVEATELAALSGRLARTAADSGRDDVRVAGSLPPLFGSYRPDLFDRVVAPSVIDPLVEGLAPHVDIWLAETLGSIAEAEAVRDALDRAGSDAPLWISYALDDAAGAVLRTGEQVSEAVAAAAGLGAASVMFNCSQAETITTAIEIAIGELGPEIAVGGYANRFVADHTSHNEANAGMSRLRDDLTPTDYGQFVRSWLDAGATVVGGCCGMEPAHIAHIAALVADHRSSAPGEPR